MQTSTKTDLPDATVVITTRNRRDELRRAIESTVTQAARIEVIVIDDGSTDGTSEMVRSDFPQVRLIRHERARGLIVRRNEGARAAAGGVVFSIDDDAAFSTPHIIQQTLDEFSSECVAAVAIPYIDVNRDKQVRQLGPEAKAVYVTGSYVGTAHAVRRDVFLSVGGYCEHFVHQGEEGDLCIRMLNAGYMVRLGSADPIHHFQSPKRDLSRMDYYGCRNAVLFAWQNVPFPFLFAHLPVTTIRCLLFTLRPDRLKRRFLGLVDGYTAILRRRRERRPVSARVYRVHRKLKKVGPCTLQEATRRLPFLKQEHGVVATDILAP